MLLTNNVINRLVSAAGDQSTDVLNEADRLTLLQITGIISLSYQVDIWEFLKNLEHKIPRWDQIRHFVDRKTCKKPDLKPYIKTYGQA